MSQSKLAQWIPLSADWSHAFVLPQGVSDPKEPLGYMPGAIGNHENCGEFRVRAMNDAEHGMNRVDMKITCDGCDFALVVPRKVRTYGDLEGYLYTLFQEEHES